MYKITPFCMKFCYLWRKELRVLDDDCNTYTIWNFRPMARWATIKKLFGESSVCPATWFPVIYWTVLSTSILGSMYSFNEFIGIFWCNCKHVTMWRQRQYYVLPSSVLRKCRLAGSFIMLNLWLLLCYAIVTVSPSHMKPWLTMNMFILCFELLVWIVEVLVGATKLEMQTVLTFTLPIINYYCVRCVHNVFQRAIEMNDIDGLHLWNSLKF